ncbi:membrane protein [Cryptococcus bacillisporus CA1873]|uniref:Membrane protein n=2 Tax=Cryptococcus gattii species complex TaxID=1884637 RepID=A0ABR5BAB9_CRYGA|nr:membrane protein [Cryptococcus bacillisporus CA1873]|eukprot:KIR60535.1 membrane protein [Cryptococcus gattii CA1873]
MTSATGVIIYKAFAPTIKIMICITIGFVLTKKGLFAPANAKGVNILSLNVGLPALVFGSMISAFTSENIKAFGPLILIAVLYMILGFICAWFVREFFFVPPDFRYGILVMGALSNWGNLPTAVVQTLAKSAPFDPGTDVELGVAYIAVFVLAMNVCLFPMGLHKICAWDFRQENLIKPRPLPVKERWGKRLRSINGVFRKDKNAKKEDDINDEKIEEIANGIPSPEAETHKSKTSIDFDEGGEEPSEMIQRARFAGGADVARKKSRASSFHSMMETTRSIPATAPLDASGIAEPCLVPSTTNRDHILPVDSRRIEPCQYHHPVTPAPSIHKPSWGQRLLKLAREFVMPLTVAIILGIICSVISPIKALFVPVDGWSGTRIPYAPDGKPPLSFITDTANFLGGMSIPAGLILLGASFGRLKMPKKWSDIPVGAIIAMTAFKMIIIPVFGVFVVQAFRDDTGLYPREDKMRTFVSILLAGTPAAVNQLVITQLYNPEGTADTLSSFLALQYVLMPILSTILAAVALYVAEQA